MPRLIELECQRTYATRENAQRAVEKKFTAPCLSNLRYIIYTTPEGRFFPVFIGQEALHAMVHFHFNVIT